MGENKLHVSSSPHIRAKVTTQSIMFTVILALMPATLFGIWNFGLNALVLILISIAACVLTEYLYEHFMHKKITIKDGSAVLTGLLLALNLPANAPWWLPVIGGVFAVLIVKQLFGGLGQNIMNPALAARSGCLRHRQSCRQLSDKAHCGPGSQAPYPVQRRLQR